MNSLISSNQHFGNFMRASNYHDENFVAVISLMKVIIIFRGAKRAISGLIIQAQCHRDSDVLLCMLALSLSGRVLLWYSGVCLVPCFMYSGSMEWV